MFNVNEQTINIRPNDSVQASRGDIIHDSAMCPSFNHDTFFGPTAIMPAPKRAPTTVWVPEIGIPKKDEDIMKTKEARQTENIIILCSDGLRKFKVGIMSADRVAATLLAQNIAPTNSEIDPIITSFLRERALDPYDVASPFAASFDPIEKDINRLKIITKIIQMSIFILNIYFYRKILFIWGLGFRVEGFGFSFRLKV